MPLNLLLLGPRKRRRRVPRQIAPVAIERDYYRTLVRVLSIAEMALQPLIDALPSLVAGARQDAGEGDIIRSLTDRARSVMQGTISTEELSLLLDQLARRVSVHNRLQLTRQIRAIMGADVFFADPGLSGAIANWAAENAALIRTIPGDLLSEVERIATRGIASATSSRQIAKEIRARFGVSRSRAQLIATDQIGKLQGQVNERRQKSIGVDKYIWRTAQDRRVRGTPGGAFPHAKPSHYAREGKTFSWDNPPEDGHPGQPIRCRCYAEPVLAL